MGEDSAGGALHREAVTQLSAVRSHGGAVLQSETAPHALPRPCPATGRPDIRQTDGRSGLEGVRSIYSAKRR